METNNIYKRSFKTKKEEYEEKLKQRNVTRMGAPLSEKNGNVISNLRTILIIIDYYILNKIII